MSSKEVMGKFKTINKQYEKTIKMMKKEIHSEVESFIHTFLVLSTDPKEW